MRGKKQRIESVRRGSSADENFGNIVWWGEGKEDGRPVNGVGDSDVIRDVWQDRFGVGLDIINDRLIVGYHKYATIGEREYPIICAKESVSGLD